MKNVLFCDLPWVIARQTTAFCEAMCDHMQVHVYILLFAKYGKHKLTHKYASYTLQGSFNKSHC